MLTADIPLNEFNRGMSRLIARANVEPKRMMKKELLELTKTLIKVSPPRNLTKSKRSVVAGVAKKFEGLDSESGYARSEVPVGKSGVKWYAASSKFLYGAAPDSDMRKADVNTLRGIYYKTKTVQGGKRLVLGFKNRSGAQKVAMITKIIVKQNANKQVAARINKNFGRLKAGWLGPVNRGAITLSGGNMPPEMVLRHKSGARTDFINMLEVPSNPSFITINRSMGVTSDKSKFYIDLAMNIRARAMKKNAETILSGKSQYVY